MATDHRPRLSAAVYRKLHDRAKPEDSIDDVAQRVLERDSNTQAVRNALEDLENLADALDRNDRFNADMVREPVETIRDELGENDV